MATCPINKADSNSTSLSFAEEECFGVLPSTTPNDESLAVWYNLEPNSYSDFGGTVITEARNPINPSRQNKKGTVVDLEASAGFSLDFTKTNLNRLMQGFFFADARQKITTNRFLLPKIQVQSVSIGPNIYQTASSSGILAFNLPDYLVFAEGFSVSSNNGLKTIVAATTSALQVADALSVEASPPSDVNLTVVGFKFASDDANLTVNAGVVSLTTVSKDLTTFNFIPGEWVFIGGDAIANRFNSFSGYARIKSISANAIVFDDLTSNLTASDLGVGKSVHIYFGHIIKNENDPMLIKKRSYNLERQLGLGVNGTQAQYVIGSVPNELSLKFSSAKKIEADLSFVSSKEVFRSGDPGDLIKIGTRIPSKGESPYTTTKSIYKTKISLNSTSASFQPSLLNFIEDFEIKISNGVSGIKALSVLGSFDTTFGNFEVTGSLTGMFTTVAANKAVLANSDVGLSTIVADSNGGWIFDMPLMNLEKGLLGVEKDKQITIPLDQSTVENSKGYTALYNFFTYLPTLAMPK